MPRKRKKSGFSAARVAALVALLLIGAGVLLWPLRHRMRMALPDSAPPIPETAVNASPAPIAPDHATAAPAAIPLHGMLEIRKPPRDAQLGIAADAVILLRIVELYQWQERCDGAHCSYAKAWSQAHIDSRRFRNPAGHENPQAPFADATFKAGEVRLGDLDVDADLVAASHPAVDYPVRDRALPPNLAATFSVVDGVLYAGGDPAHPQVGTLRIRYRIVPGGEVSLSGVRRGSKLEAH
jgi:hypothetical protein